MAADLGPSVKHAFFGYHFDSIERLLESLSVLQEAVASLKPRKFRNGHFVHMTIEHESRHSVVGDISQNKYNVICSLL